jgi:hypothetical protein
LYGAYLSAYLAKFTVLILFIIIYPVIEVGLCSSRPNRMRIGCRSELGKASRIPNTIVSESAGARIPDVNAA